MRIPTDRGPLALKMLLVVKLKCIHQNFKFDYVNAKKTKNRYHVKVLPRRVRHLKDLVHRLKEVKATFTILHHSLGEQKSSCVKVIILHKNGWLTDQFYSRNVCNQKITPAACVLGIEVNNTWLHRVFMGIKGRVLNFWDSWVIFFWKLLKNTKKKFREKKYIVTIW